MALPDLASLKLYLRVETTAEDTVLTDILSQAVAWAEALLGKPITAVSRTFTVTGARDQYGRSYFYLPTWPVSTLLLDAPVITDSESSTVLDTTYTFDGLSGRFLANTDEAFSNAPYRVVAKVGLSAHPQYSTTIELQLRTLIIGLASIIYHQRNPNASTDSDSGNSVSYFNQPLPKDLDSIISRLNPPRVR